MTHPAHDEKPTTKPCRVCGEDIKLAAIKCVHCSSWQNPLGEWSNIFTTALPLLVALVSVSIAAIPIISKALIPKRTIISAVFQADTFSHISLLATNSGGRPGSINRASLAIPEAKRGYYLDVELDVVAKDSAGAVVIPPQQSLLVLLHSSATVASECKEHSCGWIKISDAETERIRNEMTSAGESNSAKCTITYFMTNFDGSEDNKDFVLRCSAMQEFINEHAQWHEPD